MSSESNWLAFFQERERLHADYYLDFAQQHARRDPEAYEQLEGESGNLLKIAAWLAEQNEAEGILRLAEALWQESDFMRSRGFMQRGLSLLEQAREAARQIGDLRAEFIWLEALAYVHYDANHPLALPLYEQTLALIGNIDEPRLKAQALLGMGRLQTDMGHLDRAAAMLKEALQEYRHIQDYEGEIQSLVALANLSSLQGDPTIALSYLEQGLLLAQAKRDLHNEADLRYAFGYAQANAQAWSEAASHFEATIEIARTAGDLQFEARGMTALGEALLAQGDVQRAIPLLEIALARQEINDDFLTVAFTRFCLAKGYNILNQPHLSLVHIQKIYSYLLDMRHFPFAAGLAAESAWLKADNYLKQNNFEQAKLALNDVLILAPAHLSHIRQAALLLLEELEQG